ncbi:MAG: acetylxylan esterase [Ginsengibacter sp.]
MSSKFILYTVLFSFLFCPVFGKASNKNINVFSIGNANVAECPLTSHERGWMQMLPMFFGLNVHFNNYAITGKSADAFLNEGNWNVVLNQLKEGDYVFISFDNDSSTSINGKEIYQKAITRFIADINQKKAIPVLFTPIITQKENEVIAASIKEISGKNKIVCIDLSKPTENIREKINQKEKNNLSINEAIQVARIAAQSIKNKIPDFELSDAQNANGKATYLPAFANETADIIASNLKQEAALDFNVRQLPVTKTGWESYRKKLRNELLKASGVEINHSLPLDIHETGSIKMNGYTIKKIYFQTKPNVYATADLYVPDGKGIFPAIINMHGHWPHGKVGEMVQPRAHELALNGYVCLNIDAWGSGERTTVHGIDEYHGSNLGASLMNIGETLLGNQLTDNMRGVDLLSSLHYVDKNNIGATGASGGGNQTMWLSALDERIKASMPVVSVGTFQSYIMGSNCVCELMPEGLTFTEESGVLALIAPRSVKICSGLKDVSPTFYPSEMMRSYTNAKPIFALYNTENNIRYQLFNTPHGYWPEMRQAMLGWFDLKLKGIGNGDFKEEIPFTLLPNEQLMVFPKGKRDPLVVSTSDYCIQKGEVLSNSLYKKEIINKEDKLKKLRDILLLPAKPDVVEKVHEYEKEDGWRRIVLETTNKHLIPLRYFPSVKNNAPLVIICSDSNMNEKEKILIKDYIQKGYGIVVADVWGKGELASSQAKATDGRLPEFHTLARAELWLGKTIVGLWVSDIDNLIKYAQKNYKPSSVTVDASKEIAIAALMQSALNNNVNTCILRTCPLSYALDRREGIDFFNMAIHVPGILQWGDISLIAGLNKRTELIFKDPVSVTGRKIKDKQLSAFKEKFSKMKAACKSENKILFIN